MAATVTQVVTGIKNRLATISGLRAFDYQPEQINPVIGFPIVDRIEYHRAFSGGDVVFFVTVTVIVGRYTDRTAFALLDDFMAYSGAKSIRAALEGDPTLGGIASNLIVRSSADIRSASQGDAEFLEVQFQMEVHG